MLEHLIHVKSWFNRCETEQAEQKHFAIFNRQSTGPTTIRTLHTTVDTPKKQEQASLSEQIRDVRKIIHSSCSITTEESTAISKIERTMEQRLVEIESTHRNILQMIEDLKRRVDQLENNKQPESGKPTEVKPAPAPAAAADDDDDVDLFGSDDEEQNEETKKRLAEYAAKKTKKEQVIAKSSILLDVKPWDDETDINAMEKAVRSIEADGLIWGPAKHIPVAYGVKKLQINCVVEDDKIGTDFLEEKICEFEEYVQSVDVASFNKI